MSIRLITLVLIVLIDAECYYERVWKIGRGWSMDDWGEMGNFLELKGLTASAYI